ncbi:hypothetical protein BT69DRAFT_331416 [Atractiella rhizophila]|nr:hypothetical protein BT69DRAFT_331416 [Atractiella rhizophila]
MVHETLHETRLQLQHSNHITHNRNPSTCPITFPPAHCENEPTHLTRSCSNVEDSTHVTFSEIGAFSLTSAASCCLLHVQQGIPCPAELFSLRVGLYVYIPAGQSSAYGSSECVYPLLRAVIMLRFLCPRLRNAKNWDEMEYESCFEMRACAM